MDIQYKITRNLASAGLEYLQIGINRFHRTDLENQDYYQSSIGNICVGVELILKAIIAERNFSLLFSNLPLEAKVKLTDKQSENIKLPPYHVQNIESFTYNSLKLNKCISIFYHLHPEVKQEFNPFLKTISEIRNVSVHGVIPNFQKYTLEWVAYSAISLLKFLKTQEYSFLPYSPLSEEDENFYQEFNQERNERVQKAVREAQEKAKQINPSSIIEPEEKDWQLYIIECPICKSDAFLEGFTEFEYEETYDGAEVWLSFYGSDFKCEDCGLVLTGIEELTLVGIERYYDRSEDLEIWLEEQEMDAEQYL